TKMYYIDSQFTPVNVFDYNAESGDISNKRVLVDRPDLSGHPDGMCVDAEGFLWVAFWGGGAIRRFHPDGGEMLAEISVPAARSSCCCFGGENLDRLFITTARSGMDEDEKRATPDAGAVFVCDVGVKGRETRSYQGNPSAIKESNT
ncbi:MAG: SMP-30/gluconolactonase/LRE family protein, partial [Candidatus Sumerlaeota bacterium]